MNEFILFFTIILIVTIFWFHLEKKSTEVFYVTSSLDNKAYLVRKMPPGTASQHNSQAAADMLANINMRNKALIKHMYDNRQRDDFKNKKSQIEYLKSNYNENAISESSPNNKYTSYSINKGEKIVFCLRDKKPPFNLVDLNTVMFVSIHELAHLMTKAIGHPPEFWVNMRSLLKESINSVKVPGTENFIYTAQDFESQNVEYCGMTITSTPCDQHQCSNVKHFTNYQKI